MIVVLDCNAAIEIVLEPPAFTGDFITYKRDMVYSSVVPHLEMYLSAMGASFQKCTFKPWYEAWLGGRPA
ncbi:hypothetical protein AGMMS49944_17080 [Spirochaetia bacterium]|nr:hypothetical protein AGMMS49944_17080 [Spirochaetia bacterium]